MPRNKSATTPYEAAKNQAINIMKQVVKANELESRGTVRNYTEQLKLVALHANQNLDISLRQITPIQANEYLKKRAEVVSQKTLDMDRQAIQCMMQNVTKQLDKGELLYVVKSKIDTNKSSRTYTSEQIAIVASHQTEKNALATEIAYATGIRAHELATLLPVKERAADIRPASEDKFSGRDGAIYTVTGKGGLVREILVPYHISAKLEERRLDVPIKVMDRDIQYEKHYDIGSGKAWSKSFSSASKRCLGFSKGAHGLRHTYVQERIAELQNNGASKKEAKLTASQEVGHFREDIVNHYLR